MRMVRNLAVILFFGTSGCAALAAELNLYVQPGLGGESAERFAPFARYLSEGIGHQVNLRMAPSMLAHWRVSRDPKDMDLVLDDAHFTDYRRLQHGFVILAKVEGGIAFSLVAVTNALTPDELSGRTVAVPPAPSLATARLLQLFPDPVKAPRLLQVSNFDRGVRAVRDGRAQAALIPTHQLHRFADVRAVLDTEASPEMALSISPRLAKALAKRVRAIALKIPESVAGRAVLDQIRLPGFEAVESGDYLGYARLLEGTWGY